MLVFYSDVTEAELLAQHEPYTGHGYVSVDLVLESLDKFLQSDSFCFAYKVCSLHQSTY